MQNICYVNGEFLPKDLAKINVEDRGYQFADGVYEVILAQNSKLVDFVPHMERLQYSLDGIRIKYAVRSDNIKNIINELLDLNKLKNAIVYLQITRGVASRNHQFPDIKIEPSFVITVTNLPEFPQSIYIDGVKTIMLPDIRWKRRDFKTIGLLANVLAKQEALEKGFDDAILVEDNKFITETSSANFFIIDKDGNIVTHPANNFILNGITRRTVIKIAQELGYNIIERAISLDEIRGIKEAFITSTIKKIVPVTQIDDFVIGGKSGAVTNELIKSYNDYLENLGDEL